MTKTEAHWTGRRLLRWTITQWCNYSCWYCRQDHSRKQEYYGGAGHWIDNAPVDRWLGAFDRHYTGEKLTLMVTGGEPFLDRRPFSELIAFADDREYIEGVEVVTNLTWNLPYQQSSKVALMVSYHPTHVTEDAFFSKLREVVVAGWRAPVVNLVVLPERVADLGRLATRCIEAGSKLNALPAFSHPEQFSVAELAELKLRVPELDWPHRIKGVATRNRPCFFPSLAHEMLPNGKLISGCHNEAAGNFFDEVLPALQTGYSPCPHNDCFCDNKVAFLYDDNTHGLPLERLADRIPLPLC